MFGKSNILFYTRFHLSMDDTNNEPNDHNNIILNILIIQKYVNFRPCNQI